MNADGITVKTLHHQRINADHVAAGMGVLGAPLKVNWTVARDLCVSQTFQLCTAADFTAVGFKADADAGGWTWNACPPDELEALNVAASNTHGKKRTNATDSALGFWTADCCDPTTTTTTPLVLPPDVVYDGFLSRGCYNHAACVTEGGDTFQGRCESFCEPWDARLDVICCHTTIPQKIYLCDFIENGTVWNEAADACGTYGTDWTLCTAEQLSNYLLTPADFDGTGTAGLAQELQDAINNHLPALPVVVPQSYGCGDNTVLQMHPVWTSNKCKLPLYTGEAEDSFHECRCEETDAGSVALHNAHYLCGKYMDNGRRKCVIGAMVGSNIECDTDDDGDVDADDEARQDEGWQRCEKGSTVSSAALLRDGHGYKRSVAAGTSLVKVASRNGGHRCQPIAGHFAIRCCNTKQNLMESVCDYKTGATFGVADRACQGKGPGWGLCSAKQLAHDEGVKACNLDSNPYWTNEACSSDTKSWLDNMDSSVLVRLTKEGSDRQAVAEKVIQLSGTGDEF